MLCLMKKYHICFACKHCKHQMGSFTQQTNNRILLRWLEANDYVHKVIVKRNFLVCMESFSERKENYYQNAIQMCSDEIIRWKNHKFYQKIEFKPPPPPKKMKSQFLAIANAMEWNDKITKCILHFKQINIALILTLLFKLCEKW